MARIVVIRALVAFVLIQFVLISDISNSEGHQEKGIKLRFTIEMENDFYKVGDPLTLNCKLRNMASKTIFLEPILFSHIAYYLNPLDKYEVLRLYPLKFPGHESAFEEDIIKLPPGENYEFKRTLYKDHFSLPTERYRFNFFVVLTKGIKEIDGVKLWTGELKSNTVEVEIIE